MITGDDQDESIEMITSSWEMMQSHEENDVEGVRDDRKGFQDVWTAHGSSEGTDTVFLQVWMKKSLNASIFGTFLEKNDGAIFTNYEFCCSCKRGF